MLPIPVTKLCTDTGMRSTGGLQCLSGAVLQGKQTRSTAKVSLETQLAQNTHGLEQRSHKCVQMLKSVRV